MAKAASRLSTQKMPFASEEWHVTVPNPRKDGRTPTCQGTRSAMPEYQGFCLALATAKRLLPFRQALKRVIASLRSRKRDRLSGRHHCLDIGAAKFDAVGATI
jgi:hypothetical protein